jgi:benzoyl-CoA 2,3-dioxygenase component B
MQLEALAQSGFDPLSRTCRFMLTEEAHHMFVGETGVGRVIERTCQAMKDADITDPGDVEAVRKLGVIDLPTLQRKANLHFSLTLDLFGNEISTNAANAFNAGLKGRYREDKLTDDHQLLNDTYPVLRAANGAIVEEQAPALSALNMRLRDDYVVDCAAGVGRWNKVIEKAGFDFRIKLPHVAFNRQIGEFRGMHVDPDGKLRDAPATEFLPSEDDRVYIESLMHPVAASGAFANWIAAPKVGIDNKGGDFEYVKIAG